MKKENIHTREVEETVIDYVLGNEEVRERIIRLKIGEKIDSDHHPVEVTLTGRKEERRRKK